MLSFKGAVVLLILVYVYSLGTAPSAPLYYTTKYAQNLLLPAFGEISQTVLLGIQYFALLLLFIGIFYFPKAYTFLFKPVVIIRTLHEVEKDNGALDWQINRQRRLNGQSADKLKIRNNKRLGKLPPPFPNSWFKVLSADDLKAGECIDVQICGQAIVIFRSEDGKNVSALNAYCPHLGANLGVMGKVTGDCIRCPFHGWKFDGKGKCVEIPYAEKIPTFAKTKSWNVCEKNGMIYVYHDAEDREPTWEIPEVKEIATGGYVFHGRSEHQIRAHIQEIPENGPDTAHLNVLHVPLTITRLGLDKFFSHVWSASWKPGVDDESHLAHIKVLQKLKFLGKYDVPGTTVDVTITQVGPGLVHLHFQTPFGKVTVFETVTPIEPVLQSATHQVYAERRVPRWFAKFVLNNLIVQFERDIPIWNNKTYLPNPMVIKEDGDIVRFRRWFTQFYSENSRNVWKDPLDW
eukprot:TRINITY_DN10425_c0_g1_i1.p1 TRINITY_DN10425_c0_g1~~TRINITY_DN10425_c0_g1_i1.p1  ORF type:complete len:461 (+),score=75.62 TRINITY_DN10425_c0_g1_i1:419-1801(+)